MIQICQNKVLGCQFSTPDYASLAPLRRTSEGLRSQLAAGAPAGPESRHPQRILAAGGGVKGVIYV